MSINTNITSETTQLAAQSAPEFKFSGPVEITGASAKHAALIASMHESAYALTETAGKSLTAGAAAGLLTQNPVIGLAVGGAVAFHTVFSGSKKGTREV